MALRSFGLCSITRGCATVAPVAASAVHVPRAWFSAASPKGSTFAVAFDVDGVLLRGKERIGNSSDTLHRLRKHHIPFMMLTNGGGVPEHRKAAQLSDLLDIEIKPDQVQLSHTPMQGLVSDFGDKTVLVVGKDSAPHILQDYGFQKLITIGQLHSQFPLLFPDYPPEPAPEIAEHRQPIAAIMALMDPRQWHRELQIVNDVLISDGRVGTVVNEQQVPIFFSCPDFEYVTEYHVPRYGAGVFGMVAQFLYERSTGRELQLTQYGKPFKSTYRYAEGVLARQAEAMGYSSISRVYMVGDNPKSDIRGANAAGDHWRSVLVRSGMFQGPPGTNDPEDPGDAVVQDVQAAVDWIFGEED